MIQNIPPENILKQHPIISIQWRWGEEQARRTGKQEEEEEASDADSDCSVNTVKSVEQEAALDTGQFGADIKGLCQASLPASVVSSRMGSRRGSGDAGWAATRRSGQPAVRVECEGGRVFYADQVICTMPLGRTQAQLTSFYCNTTFRPHSK